MSRFRTPAWFHFRKRSIPPVVIAIWLTLPWPFAVRFFIDHFSGDQSLLFFADLFAGMFCALTSIEIQNRRRESLARGLISSALYFFILTGILWAIGHPLPLVVSGVQLLLILILAYRVSEPASRTIARRQPNGEMGYRFYGHGPRAEDESP